MQKILILVALIFGSLHMQAQQKFNLVIHFNSIGTGVADRKPVDEYVRKFRQANHIKSIKAYNGGVWGREGEYDLGFQLTEFTKAQQLKFIKGLKTVTQKMKPGNVVMARNEEVRSGRTEPETLSY